MIIIFKVLYLTCVSIPKCSSSFRGITIDCIIDRQFPTSIIRMQPCEKILVTDQSARSSMMVKCRSNKLCTDTKGLHMYLQRVVNTYTRVRVYGWGRENWHRKLIRQWEKLINKSDSRSVRWCLVFRPTAKCAMFSQIVRAVCKLVSWWWKTISIRTKIKQLLYKRTTIRS